MTEERRREKRREEDEPLGPLSALRKELEKHQFQTERRHTENIQQFDAIGNRLEDGAKRLENIDGEIRTLKQVIADHLKEEGYTRRAIQELHECVDTNARDLRDQITGVRDEFRVSIADMKDNFLPLLLKDAGKKTWWLATLGRKCVQWLSPVVLFALLLWAIVLWLIGKGPFPHP